MSANIVENLNDIVCNTSKAVKDVYRRAHNCIYTNDGHFEYLL